MNEHAMHPSSGAASPAAAPRQDHQARRLLGGTIVAVALAASACAPVAGFGDRQRPVIAAPAAHPTATGRASTLPSSAPASPVDDALRRVIERGNDEQVRAIAAHDPSVMADTSTSRYYQELVQTNQQLLDHGVAAIKLVALDWGQVEINGNTATATTFETWRTSYTDGTTEDARDRNVYTLVRDGSSWRIDADAHPDDGQAPAGAPPRARPEPAPEPRAPAPQVPGARNTSTNWSGYAASGGTFTAVSGTWTVPQAVLEGGFGASATWVGIGGTRTRDLIQAGTQEVVSGSGRVSYGAWIETLPQASRSVPLAVAPGDSVTVSITRQAGDNWLIVLANNTTGQSYKQNVAYQSCLCSAEWIEEAPSMGRRGVVPLDDFGTVQFTNGSAVKDGRTVDVTGAGARAVRMVGAGGQTLATPSVLGPDGASFSVARDAAMAGQGGSSAQGGQSGQGSSGGQGGQSGPGRPRRSLVPPLRRQFGF